MGSYCTLFLDRYPLFSNKSYAFSDIMMIYRESDIIINEPAIVSLSDDEEVIPDIYYKASIRNVRDRLDIMGFNMKALIQDFDKSKLKIMRENQDHQNFFVEIKEMHDSYEKNNKILEESSIDDFINAFNKIITGNLSKESEFLSDLYKFILKDALFDNFPTSDTRFFLRALAESMPPDSSFIYDLTDVYHAGYYDYNNSAWKDAMRDLAGDILSEKIILLTEGSMDSRVLKKSLQLLYPHLTDYYHFMDFKFKPPLGAGQLVNIAKTFAASGINNRIIILFDNDYGAFNSVKSLKSIKLPDNYVVLHYPNLDFAKDYPVTTEHGIVNMDINRLACSLELYYGNDIVNNDNNIVAVFQTNGLKNGYKLEDATKKIMYKKFIKKITRCLSGKENINNYDWSGVELILKSVFEAFQVK